MMLGAQGVGEIRKVKNLLDPKGILNKNDMVRIPWALIIGGISGTILTCGAVRGPREKGHARCQA